MSDYSICNRNISLTNMLQPLGRLFNLLTAFDAQIIKESDFLLVKNSFYVVSNQGTQSQILLGLSDKFLFANWKVSEFDNLYCRLSFDLKFQILRKEWVDQKTPGVPYGIRFEKDKNHEVIQILSNHPAVVAQWGLALERKINQKNFHQLFKAKKKIGKGAFATVYLAERLIDKKLVAIKAFSKEKQYAGDKGKQSLENQIKIMRGVDHVNITKLEGVYETQNSIYVILECMEGCQLNEELKSGRKYNQHQCIIIIKQILEGLKHLAARRIIHRDLKPENIMFKNAQSLNLGICDFGLATYIDEEKYLFVRCGTPGFVAPEIINIQDMSAKSESISDVFSAGIIFHYLLLGKSIFPGKKYKQVLSQNRSCDFNFQKEEYQKLPLFTLDLLKKMLDKCPQTRITAAEALKHPALETQMDIQQEIPLKNKKNALSGFLQRYTLQEKEKIQRIQFQNNKENNMKNGIFSNPNRSEVKKNIPSFLANENSNSKPHFKKNNLIL